MQGKNMDLHISGLSKNYAAGGIGFSGDGKTYIGPTISSVGHPSFLSKNSYQEVGA